MNKKQLLIKLLAIVVGGIAVFLLSSCFTSLRILSCKKSCMESCKNSDDRISGNETGIYYTLSNDGESYMVSEVGYNETLVVIPETYDGLPVTGIKSGAFTHYKYGSGCGGDYPVSMTLSSLTLPKTIKVIERGTFLGNGNFDDCGGSGAICETLIYEGTVEDWLNISIGSSPFSVRTKFYVGGEELTDLTVPETVTTINEKAFAYYSRLENVTLHENITAIGGYAFFGSNIKEIAFPCKDLTIGDWAFTGCQSLEKITFTGENLVLGNGVFDQCYSLKEVEWNTVNIKEIPAWAFFCCRSLESFVIPASVEDIGNQAFDGCYNLTEVYNLSKLEIVAGSSEYGGVAYYAGVVHTAEEDDSYILTVDDYKFVVSEEKTTLFKYTGEDTVLFLPELEGGAAYDIRANTFMNNQTITTVSIPDCVTAIGNNAFYSCENLQIVTGGKGLVSVGDRAFNWCLKLASIELIKVEEIGNYAFHNCVALKSLTLPESLTKIGNGAFNNCEGLTSLTLPISLTEIGSGAFAGCTAEITYAGTLEEWGNVTLSKDALNEVTVTCSDGEVWEGKI